MDPTEFSLTNREETFTVIKKGHAPGGISMMESEKIEKAFLTGTSAEAYRYFGAHLTQEYGKNGVRFTVYAPHAKNVSLIGSFNDWHCLLYTSRCV